MLTSSVVHGSEVHFGIPRGMTDFGTTTRTGAGLRVFFAPPCHLFMGGEPAFAARLHVLDQSCKHRHPRAMASDMRMHGKQEKPAFVPCAVEFSGEDLFDR